MDPRPRRLVELPLDLDRLNAEAIAEGFLALDRLIEEWHSGVNRFDGPGEVLLAVRERTATIAIGGLNLDPFAPVEENAGRVRHLYVVAARRNHQIGEAMMIELERLARLHPFTKLTLFTPSEDAGRFYERLGFERVDAVRGRSHEKPLG